MSVSVCEDGKWRELSKEEENDLLDQKRTQEFIRIMEEGVRREKVSNMTLEEKVDFLLEELYIKKVFK